MEQCPGLDRRVLISFIVPLGLFFWDYGNAFLLEARRAGADVDERKENGSRLSGAKENGGGEGAEMEKASSSIAFRYPSYVQDIMG